MLTNESLADKATAAAPLNLAIGPDTAGRPAARITGRLRPTIRPPTRVINLCRGNQSEGFMGAFLIINPQPSLKAPLLRGRGARRRSGGVSLEFPMPLLMRGIIAWPGATAERRHDAQTNPPRTQLRKPGWTGAGPRPSLISMDPARQAKPAKQPGKFALHAGQLVAVEHLHTQAIATVGIPHRQGITTPAIASIKVAFEINRPNLVGTGRAVECRPGAIRSAPTPQWLVGPTVPL